MSRECLIMEGWKEFRDFKLELEALKCELEMATPNSFQSQHGKYPDRNNNNNHPRYTVVDACLDHWHIRVHVDNSSAFNILLISVDHKRLPNPPTLRILRLDVGSCPTPMHYTKLNN